MEERLHVAAGDLSGTKDIPAEDRVSIKCRQIVDLTFYPKPNSSLFADQEFIPHPITKHEYYTQRTDRDSIPLPSLTRIFFALLRQQTTQIVSRDVTPDFIVAELIVFLREQKIVRPGYTTLQDLISEALSAERNGLGKLLNVPMADGQLWNGYVFSAGDP